MKEFTELVSPTLTALFVKEITKSILSGRLMIGEKLPNERELAKMMKVSRAVIKGGVAQLASKGFLEVVPRTGVFVADYKRQGTPETLQSVLEHNGGKLDAPTLDSLYEMRENQETHIVRLAAERRTEMDLVNLYSQMEILESASSPQKLAEETFRFYHTLAIASGNLVYPLLVYGNRKLYTSLFLSVYRQVPKEERLRKMKCLVGLIEKGKADEAVACALDLIKWGKKMVNKYYSHL